MSAVRVRLSPIRFFLKIKNKKLYINIIRLVRLVKIFDFKENYAAIVGPWMRVSLARRRTSKAYQ